MSCAGRGWQGVGELFSKLKNRRAPGGLAGFAFDADGLGVAHIVRDKGRGPRLEGCRYIPCAEEPGRAAAAEDAVRQLGLDRRPAATVIDATAYQLLLVEAPDVQPEELRGAVRWRIKDLIDFHIDDAVIDVFEVPGQHSTGASARLMYAVAARSQAVHTSIRRLDSAGIDLKSIDIPEMCLRNVAALLPEDIEGVALLYLARDYGLIVLTRQHTLYLARRIETGYAQLEAADGAQFEALAGDIVLELQRSLDYYESHYMQAPIGHIAIAPTAVPLAALEAFVADNVSARVAACDLNALLDITAPCDPALQGLCLPAVGAALRVEATAL
ncbi:MAG TPA: hypothetical protein VFL45_03130 [Gammaproteobacteria bacterium]|nr:hypothetical protein [Gammaproteobacteria bacterium]HET7587059.1 hypothetical protein [Gammaproteobacteria bacterium]